VTAPHTVIKGYSEYDMKRRKENEKHNYVPKVSHRHGLNFNNYIVLKNSNDLFRKFNAS